MCWLALKVLLQAKKVTAEDGGKEPLTSAETGLAFGTSGQSGMALVCLCFRAVPGSQWTERTLKREEEKQAGKRTVVSVGGLALTTFLFSYAPFSQA